MSIVLHCEQVVFQILRHVRKGDGGKDSKQKKGLLGRH